MAFSLIPKEEKFFDLFESQIDRICEAAKIFKELMSHWDPNSKFIEQIRDMEHEADITTHDIIDKLNRTFITPFDREDIHELASEMDDIIDLIQGTCSKMHRYQVQKTSDEQIQMAEILCQSTETVKKAVKGLRDLGNSRRILDYCIEINSFENAADQVHELAVVKLFNNSRDAIEVIKWKEIYETLEGAIDMCEDVANIIEGIVVKQG